MKLAEALQERADLVNNIESLRSRIRNNTLVQEGEEPAENPKELIKELDGCIERFGFLASKINKTNNETKIGDMTITEVIAKKDVLILKAGAYRDFVYEASSMAGRARGTEIKIVPTLKVVDLQKTVDKPSKEIRLLDNSLQATNWSTDLIEDQYGILIYLVGSKLGRM